MKENPFNLPFYQQLVDTYNLVTAPARAFQSLRLSQEAQAKGSNLSPEDLRAEFLESTEAMLGTYHGQPGGEQILERQAVAAMAMQHAQAQGRL